MLRILFSLILTVLLTWFPGHWYVLQNSRKHLNHDMRMYYVNMKYGSLWSTDFICRTRICVDKLVYKVSPSQIFVTSDAKGNIKCFLNIRNPWKVTGVSPATIWVTVSQNQSVARSLTFTADKIPASPFLILQISLPQMVSSRSFYSHDVNPKHVPFKVTPCVLLAPHLTTEPLVKNVRYYA